MNKLLVKDLDFQVVAKEEKPVNYKIELEIEDPEGYWNGIMTLSDLMRNLEKSVLDATSAE